MDYVNLGRSGLKISRLALGTMNFGYVTEEAEAFKIMDAALESGINLFDTADVYGGPQRPDMEKGFGISEEIIGRWLAQDSARRDKIVLATKLYQPMGYGVNDRRLSAYHIRRACEASLRRLQTDHIDLYQMHHIDRWTPWEEIWQAMDILAAQGKITYIGSSNFAGWHIATAQGAAKKRDQLGLVAEQSLYSLVNRAAEAELIPACRYYGIGVLPWSPLSGGLLGGILSKAKQMGRRKNLSARAEALRPQIQAYEDFCRELAAEPANVALAWLLSRPAVAAPILGARTAEQLRASLPAVELRLSSDDLRQLDKIWPGPGEAPENYAW